MRTQIEVLFVDDEEHLRIAAEQTLELAGFKVKCLTNAADALSHVSRSFSGVIVSDIRMPGMDGIGLLRSTMNIDPDLPVVLVTGHGDVSLAVDAMRDGAYDFIEKPFTTERFLDSVTRACEKRLLTLENRRLREVVTHQSDDLEIRLAGRSSAMDAVRKQIRAVANTPADVLIIGETGTGKEIAAHAIHELTTKDDRPFVTINCAAMPAEMLDVELFGYEAGAFPGATRPRFGKLEHGRNGTIFLDQAHAMSPSLQSKLLRVLQDRSISRLGSSEVIELNCRFIAASNIDWEREDTATVEPERPRVSLDLIYRLNVVTLRIPPLRARKEDIPPLFTQLANEAALRFRKPSRTVPDTLMSTLMNRDWPGNVRELQNATERFILNIDDLQPEKPENADTYQVPLKDRVAAFEREAIASELRTHKGNLKPVYESLGLSRKTLYEKMQKYALDRDLYREA